MAMDPTMNRGGHDMKRIAGIIALCAVIALSLAGCMNIQQRAQEVGERIEDAEQAASAAMATAMDNRSVLEALEAQVDALEAEVNTLKAQLDTKESSEAE